MINKELELTIDQQNILNTLAVNLGVPAITDNSSIKKIADSFEVEMRNYSDATEAAIRNSFLSTMEEDVFEEFAASYGIYRKRYNSIRLRSFDQVVSVEVNKSTILAKGLVNITPFRKGDIIYSDSSFKVKTLSDITLATESTIVYPHVEISLKDDLNFTIPSGMNYITAPQQEGVANYVPQFIVTFKNTIGLVMEEEDITDFRLRVYEATYLANNMANSLVASIAKEVPFLYHIETDNIERGRAIEVLYPYTYQLVETGIDPLIDTVIVPMVESSLLSKSLQNNLVTVKSPKPLPIVAIFSNKTKLIPTQSMLVDICRNFNRTHFNTKSISALAIKEHLITELLGYELTVEDIDLVFISPNIDEETYTINNEQVLDLPVGKFLTLLGVEEKSNV